MYNLSICSAVYYNETYLNKNLRLTNLNGINYEWVVVNNTNKQEKKLNNDILDNQFKVIDGVDRDMIEVKDGLGPHNFQHGLSLNKAIANASLDSDFLLLIDPDFFIVTPIETVLNHMRETDKWLFGASYMSKTPLIYDFPVAFCLFIDLDKLSRARLDFEPGYKGFPNKDYNPDVGYSFNCECLENKVPYEFVIPSVSEPEVPPYTFTRNTLKSKYGIIYDNPVNAKGTKIDEYFWRDEIFGVHLRSKLHSKMNFYAQRVKLQMDTISSIFDQLRK